MTRFASHPGTLDVTASSSGSRQGTPLLEMRNLVSRNAVQVTLNCQARNRSGDSGSGFYYKIEAVNSPTVQALLPNAGVIQAAAGWQSISLVALFFVADVDNSPTEDIDFEVLFTSGDLDGQGQIHNFVLSGELVTLDED